MDDIENRRKWSPYAITYDPLQSGSIDGTDTTPHDRALIRAMEAKYVRPNKKVATPKPENTLFVGRLDHKTTEEGLKDKFSRYGTVTNCRVVRDVVTGFSRGYGFVQFKHHENAEIARREAHHAVLEGREILVEWEYGRTMPGWIPRRLGGGFGGKKESGQLRFGGRDRPFRKPIIIKSIRRGGSSNLDEDGVKRENFEDSSRLSTAGDEDEEDRRSSRTEDNQRNDGSGRPSNVRKPWNWRNTEGWNHSRGRERGSGQSWRDQEDWYKGEDRGYSEKSSRESDRRFSGKSSRHWSEYEERDRSEKRFRRSQDRENAGEREDLYVDGRKYSGKSSRDSSHQRRSQKGEERRRSLDREDEWDEIHQGDLGRRKHSGRSGDREDGWNSDDFDEGKVKLEDGNPKGSIKHGDDISDWKSYRSPTPERSDKERNRSRRPSKDNDTDSREDPSVRVKKRRRKSSQDQSDTEDEDDSERKRKRKRKKKKKHSKKSSLNFDSDDPYERKKDKKKKKKKHKKSRD